MRDTSGIMEVDQTPVPLAISSKPLENQQHGEHKTGNEQKIQRTEGKRTPPLRRTMAMAARERSV